MKYGKKALRSRNHGAGPRKMELIELERFDQAFNPVYLRPGIPKAGKGTTVMGKILWPPVLCAVIACQSFCAETAVPPGPILKGTINVVIADDRGIVALTDSMVTETFANARGVRISRQRSDPGQKLFRIDDRTVCTIAGFASADTPSLPEFLNNASAIMGRYEDRLRDLPGLSIEDKLGLLEAVFSHYLEGIANIRELTSSEGDYYFELLIAGYDPDGTPEVGRLILRMVSETEGGATILHAVAQERRVVAVPAGQPPLILLAGKRDVAAGLLKNQAPWRIDEAVSAYEDSVRLGITLSTEQMRALAISLKEHTAAVDNEVGGANQIAILSSGRVQSTEQPNFAPIPLIGFKFLIFTRVTMDNTNGVVRPVNGIPAPEGFPYGILTLGNFALYFKSTFVGVRQDLDDSYYSGNVFRDCLLTYNGGRMTFEKSNQVFDCDLLLGPKADQDSPGVQQLLRNFKWRNVERPREMPTSFSGVGAVFNQRP